MHYAKCDIVVVLTLAPTTRPPPHSPSPRKPCKTSKNCPRWPAAPATGGDASDGGSGSAYQYHPQGHQCRVTPRRGPLVGFGAAIVLNAAGAIGHGEARHYRRRQREPAATAGPQHPRERSTWGGKESCGMWKDSAGFMCKHHTRRRGGAEKRFQQTSSRSPVSLSPH